jgi:translation initiation factor 2B subunit (eIF-2B alpha/beta/delta family)
MGTGLISEQIQKIKLDHSNGASQIARNALDVLKFFALTNKTKTCSEFKTEFRKLGKQLFNARPNMAPIQNLVAQTVYEVLEQEDCSPVSIRKITLSKIDKLYKQSQFAVKQSAQNAATIIKDGEIVATCSFSSTVCETFKRAKKQEKQFKVIVAESKVGKTSYGKATAQFLESITVPVTVFSDVKLSHHLSNSDCVLVGADSILYDGSIINGIPSHILAVEAKNQDTPFYSVCDTTKTNISNYFGKQPNLEYGFERIPTDLITGIITEKSVLDPDKVPKIMKEKAKYVAVFSTI